MQFAPSDIFAIAIVILISMSFHEAMHAFASHWLGDPTAKDLGRLTLNPLKHIDIFMTVLLPVGLILFGMPPIFVAKPVPFHPDRLKYDEFGAALVGLAGPFTNLLLAITAAGLLRAFDFPEGLFDGLLLFIRINLAFFVFNMIPFPPLDGSRLLYAIAPEPLQRLMYSIEMMGFFPLIFFLVFLSPVVGPIVGYCVDSLTCSFLGPC